MIKQLNFKRCKTLMAMLLVLCQLFSIFGMAMPFKIDDANAVLGWTYSIKIRVHKLDAETKEYLPGAKLDVCYKISENNYYSQCGSSWTSTDTYHDYGKINLVEYGGLPEGSHMEHDYFYVCESEAPEGYDLAEPVLIKTSDIDIFKDFDFRDSMMTDEGIAQYNEFRAKIDSGEIPPDGEYVLDVYMYNKKKTIENPEGSNPDPNTSLTTEFEKVDKGEDIVVTFENEIYTVQNLTVSKTVKEEVANLWGTSIKEVNSSIDFDFTAKFSNMKAGASFTTSTGETITANANGEATATFTLSAKESIVFEGLPVGTQYQIEEKANSDSYTPSYLLSGLNVVKNADIGNKNSALKTEVETLEAREEGIVSFVNIKYIEYGEVRVEKEVKGTDTEEDFNFTISLDGHMGNGVEKYGDAMFTHGIHSFTLKDGQSKIFTLPVGTSYTVRESANDSYTTSYRYLVEDVDNYESGFGPEDDSGGEEDEMPISICINSVDEGYNDIVGAEYQLRYADGVEIGNWVSDGSTWEVDIYLEDAVAHGGKYLYVHELKAPDGYKLIDDQIISLSYEGPDEISNLNVYIQNTKADAEDTNNGVGAIVDSIPKTIMVTNTYTAVDIALSKTVDNPEVMIESEKFVIEGTFSNLEANKTYEISNGFTMTADENGDASYIARLENGEKIVFKGIPVDAIYSFEEKAGNYIASYEIVDKSKMENLN